MRYPAFRKHCPGFTLLESLLMIGLMTVLGLMSLAIYLKETDPKRKGPGVWDRKETPFVPAFHEVSDPLIIVPDEPKEDPLTDLVPENKDETE